MQPNSATESFFQAAASGDTVALMQEIAANVSINSQNLKGQTALHLACIGGHAETALALIRARANTNVPDHKGKAPLHTVCDQPVEQMRVEHFLIATYLLPNGAKVNLVDKYGKGPLHYAAEHGNKDMAKLLLSHSADPDLGSRQRRLTPYHLARRHEHRSIIELLAAAENRRAAHNKQLRSAAEKPIDDSPRER